MENLYCIAGIIEASKKFVRDEVNQEFASELKKNHVSICRNVVTEGTVVELLSKNYVGHDLHKVFGSIIGAYIYLGYRYSDDCLTCGSME